MQNGNQIRLMTIFASGFCLPIRKSDLNFDPVKQIEATGQW
jgi:hypothetical protein